MKEEDYLKATHILNWHNKEIFGKSQSLLTFSLSPTEKLRQLYTFVASLPLGYNSNDSIQASKVLKDGYGQCNTKVILLMAFSRAANIPCRVHCYRITKDAQRNRIPDWLFQFAPSHTLFTWPEFFVKGTWKELQEIVHIEQRAWDSCPFDGAAWQLEPLKREWIVRDDGVWPSQDDYFKKYHPTVHGWRAIGWHLVGRRALNKHQKELC